MTDEEKIRVEGLLKDLDELPEVLEDEVRNIILLLHCLQFCLESNAQCITCMYSMQRNTSTSYQYCCMTGWDDAFSFVSNQMLNVLHVCTVCKETPPLDINTVV